MIELKVNNFNYNETIESPSLPSHHQFVKDMEVCCKTRETIATKRKVSDLLGKREFLLKSDNRFCYIKYGTIIDYNLEKKSDYHYGVLLLIIKCKSEPLIAENKRELTKEMI